MKGLRLWNKNTNKSNDEMEDIIKIVRGVSETIQNKLKKEKRGFLGY